MKTATKHSARTLCVIIKKQEMTYYDWKNILKSKTKEELIDFIKNSHTDSDAKLIALDEFKRRRFDKKIFNELYTGILNNWNSQKIGFEKQTIREQWIRYSPHFAFFVGLIFLILFLFNQNYRPDNQFFILFLLSIITGFISMYKSKKELQKINKERERNIENINQIIQKITTHNSKYIT